MFIKNIPNLFEDIWLAVYPRYPGLWKLKFTKYIFMLFCMLLTEDINVLSSEHEEDTDIERSEDSIDNAKDFYNLKIKGDITPEIKEKLLEQSKLVKLKDKPPQTLSGLTKRVERDIEHFRNLLMIMGYCEADIQYSIDDKVQPQKIKMQITLGDRFKISRIQIIVPKDAPLSSKSSKEEIYDILHLKEDAQVDFNVVYKGTEYLEIYFKKNGYPFVTVEKPQVKINFTNKDVYIVYIVKAGFRSRIQYTTIEGLTALDPIFVKNRLLWNEGDIYDQTVVDRTRRKLLETGLLGTIAIRAVQPLEKIDEASSKERTQPIEMQVKVSEAPPRSIGAGVRYATAEGIGGRVFWSHTNLLGHGEYLNISSKVSKRQRLTKLQIDIPDFLSPRQKLMNEASINTEWLRAYSGRTYSIGSIVQRPFNEQITGGLGISGEESRLNQDKNIYVSHLVGVPVDFRWDGTEDWLNPTHGARFNIRVTPYLGKINKKQRSLTVGKGGLSAYLPLMTNTLGESAFVLAGFIRTGTIFAKNRDSIPPNKRFYGGGNDSIRGYGFQLLGPLDQNRVPLGGLSLAEYGGEIRVKTTETIGFVTFLEAGSVTNKKMPDFHSRHMLWSTGVGFRYYSIIGPIRADIGFPLKRRKDIYGKTIDAPFQFYISIGQAF